MTYSPQELGSQILYSQEHVSALEAELSELKAQNARLHSEAEADYAKIDELNRMRLDLKAQNAELLEALEELENLGWHARHCDINRVIASSAEIECTCGIGSACAKARAAIKKARQG